MIIRRKWKALLWSIGCLIVLIVTGWYLLLHIVSEVFEPECDNNRVWEINQYKIIEKKCIGFAGPHYYPVFLYKDKEKIDKLTFIPDSTCVIKFKPDTGDTLIFDICEKKLK
jgi:hypothetical protein